MSWTGPAPKPQPVAQPLSLPNSGYPILDLISGLSQVFTRSRPTITGYPDPTPTFPENIGGIWPEDEIWEQPPQRPRPPLSGDFGSITLFPKPWNDDAGKNDWLTRWNIQPAQDARYLPAFPETEDNTTGAQLSRNWHNVYKDYAFGQIKDNAPQFVEHIPEPKPSNLMAISWAKSKTLPAPSSIKQQDSWATASAKHLALSLALGQLWN